MTEQLETKTTLIHPQQINSASDADILTYLRHHAKYAEIAQAVEREALILAHCQQLNIQVSDDEWQAAGDAFRLERKLWGTTETTAWLDQQRIDVEEWSQGIKIDLLAQKLKEHLFGVTVDAAYISNRDHYRRVAMSQILVPEQATAQSIIQALTQENTPFAALAIAHSKGKQSQENGGFVGIRYLVELIPEVTAAIRDAKVGEIIGPVQTRLGYHILRIEQWFPTELNEAVRSQIIDSLFAVWLQNQLQEIS